MGTPDRRKMRSANLFPPRRSQEETPPSRARNCSKVTAVEGDDWGSDPSEVVAVAESTAARMGPLLADLVRKGTMTTIDESSPRKAPVTPGAIEANGINVIKESERKGTPAELFWPWCASNISVLAVSYGAFVLGFGIGLWQALSRRWSAPSPRSSWSAWSRSPASAGRHRRWCSRARVRPRGNTLPAWSPTSCWSAGRPCSSRSSTLATATVFERLGWAHGDGTKVVAFVVVARSSCSRASWASTCHAAPEVPHDRDDRRHRVLRRAHRGPHQPLDGPALPSGSTSAAIGAGILVMTGFGIGWVNTAADYSAPAAQRLDAGVVCWPTFGAACPSVLVAYGILLALSPDLLAPPSERPDGRTDHGPADVVPAAVLVPRRTRVVKPRGHDIYSSD